MSWEIHPAAELFPMLGTEELQALADDIKTNGQIDPIVIYEGQVLDGRNRLAACELAGVEPRTVQMTLRGGTIGPVTWVISKNLHRRHLTPTQASTVGVDALPMLEEEAKKRQGTRTDIPAKLPGSELGESREKAAALVNVSPRYISDAKAIKVKAPDQFEAMRAGTVTLQDAKREIKKRETRERLAQEFAERGTAKPTQIDSEVARRAAEIERATTFIKSMNNCIARMFSAMPGPENLSVTDAQQSKELDRIAAELVQIAHDVRNYKGEVNG
jgi:hypothetical protein